MKKSLISMVVMSTLVLAGCDAKATSTTSLDFSHLSTTQQKDLGNFVQDYLMKNPEILVKVSQQLQNKQAENRASDVIALKDKIFSSDTPHVGPTDAKVAVVEFFDYNCVYCSKMAPNFEQVMENNKDVQYYFKETPIFASHFAPSLSSALAGEYVFKEKGADAYLKYHNAIYATGHYEGALTNADINNVLTSIGVEPIAKDVTPDMVNEKKDPLVTSIDKIQDDINLSKQAGLQGTPYIIVMPLKNPTVKNVRIIDGYESASQLNQAIQEVKKMAE